MTLFTEGRGTRQCGINRLKKIELLHVNEVFTFFPPRDQIEK